MKATTDVAHVSISWTLISAATNTAASCPPGYDTAALYSQEVDANGNSIGAPLIDYTSGGSGVAWTATLDEALKLDFDRVIPGHGPIMTRAGLIAWKTSFEKVLEELNVALRPHS